MEDKDLAVVETKLGILIEDFKRFRGEQRVVNHELTKHSGEESKVQEKILTTVKWHTIIGSFMMGVIMYLVYKVQGVA